MFTVHSRGVFTQDKSDYISNSKVYRKKWDREKVFTIKGCSLIRGVHYERFHCSFIYNPRKLEKRCFPEIAVKYRVPADHIIR